MSATFEAHGKTWTRHVPGGAMPCDGAAAIDTLLEDQSVGGTATPAKKSDWGKRDDGEQIIGWRYADEAKPEPSELEKLRAENKAMREAIWEAHDSLDTCRDNSVELLGCWDWKQGPEETRNQQEYSRLQQEINAADAALDKLKPFLP